MACRTTRVTVSVMGLLSLVWPALSIMTTAAHFYRNGNSSAALLYVFALAAFAVRRPWAVQILQFFLALGVVEWGRTTFMLMHARLETGAPYFRLTLILGSVTLLTLASLLVFRIPTVRRHFTFISAPLDETDEKRREVSLTRQSDRSGRDL